MSNICETAEKTIYFTVGDKSFATPTADVKGVISLRRDSLFPIPFLREKRILGLFRSKGIVFPLSYVGENKTVQSLSEVITVLMLQCGGKSFGIPVDFICTDSDEAKPKSFAFVSAQQIMMSE